MNEETSVNESKKKKKKKKNLILLEVSQDGCSLICVDCSLKSIDE